MINPLQLAGIMRNPQGFINQMMNNSSISTNPIARNAFNMYQKGDTEGLNKLADNLCHEKGINLTDAINQIKSQLGM